MAKDDAEATKDAFAATRLVIHDYADTGDPYCTRDAQAAIDEIERAEDEIERLTTIIKTVAYEQDGECPNALHNDITCTDACKEIRL